MPLPTKSRRQLFSIIISALIVACLLALAFASLQENTGFSLVTNSTSSGPIPRMLERLSCEGDCTRTKIVTLPTEETLYDSGDCKTCTEVYITSRQIIDGTVLIDGYAILGSDQQVTIPTTVINPVKEKEWMNKPWQVSIPTWTGTEWDVEKPVKTFTVSLNAEGENLVRRIDCEGGCDGYRIFTDRGEEKKTIILDGCADRTVPACTVYTIAHGSVPPSVTGGASGYEVGVMRQVSLAEADVDVELFHQLFLTEEIKDTVTIPIKVMDGSRTITFELVDKKE